MSTVPTLVTCFRSLAVRCLWVQTMNQMPSDNSLTVPGRSYEVLTWAVSLEHRLKGA